MGDARFWDQALQLKLEKAYISIEESVKIALDNLYFRRGAVRKHILAGVFVFGMAPLATAQEAPKFFADTYPEHALGAALQARGALFGENATLDAKTRELIGIAVAAQIPCSYCSYGHTERAKALGASNAEIREAVAMAAYVRHWSTVLNGMQYDLGAFKAEYDELTKKSN